MTLSLPILLMLIGFLALGMVALGLAWGQSADVLNGVDD